MKKLTFPFNVLMSILCINIIASIFSCSSNEFDNEEEICHSKQVSNKNVSNPYDFVGEYHNEGLLYVLQKLENVSSIKTRSMQSDSNTNIIKDLTLSFRQENLLKSDGIEYPIVISYPTSNSTIPLSTRSLKKQYSSNVQYYLSLFEKKLKDPGNIYSIEEFIDKINDIEQDIIFSDMTEEEKTILLLSYAVGKYSLKFWLDISKKETSPLVKTRSESFSDWWSNCVTPAIESVVTADFVGAAAGALEGLISGAAGGSVLAPGPGTVTGGVAGAVGGAATGAVYSSVIDGVMYYFNTK